MHHIRTHLKSSLLAIALLVLASNGLAAGNADSSRGSSHLAPGTLLFTQEDVVTTLDIEHGVGVRTGTVRGRINGTMTTDIHFVKFDPLGDFQADDQALLTDIDGDQILFRVISTGRFVVPSLGGLNLLSGPFTASYEVIAATGKFAGQTGRKFFGKGLGTSPAALPVPGTVFTQVYGVLHP